MYLNAVLPISTFFFFHEHSAAKIQKWIGVRFERGLSVSLRISQLGSPLGGVRSI